jgi:hypothetical protein
MSRAFAQETSPLPPSGLGNIVGQVVDATDATPIAGATVTVESTGMTTSTDSSGNYSFNDVPAGTQTLQASAAGYVTATTSVDVIDGDTVNKLIALSPVSTEAITAVLTWGANPADLDLHASGPDGMGGSGRFHAFFGNPTPVDHVALDRDDTSSFGPETMSFKISSVGGAFVAGTYRVWVHDFTNRLGTPQWGVSNAGVGFNGLSGQIAEYLVSTAVANQGGTVDPDDDLWRVFQFDLDTAGNISNVVVFQDFVIGTAGTADV